MPEAKRSEAAGSSATFKNAQPGPLSLMSLTCPPPVEQRSEAAGSATHPPSLMSLSLTFPAPHTTVFETKM